MKEAPDARGGLAAAGLKHASALGRLVCLTKDWLHFLMMMLQPKFFFKRQGGRVAALPDDEDATAMQAKLQGTSTVHHQGWNKPEAPLLFQSEYEEWKHGLLLSVILVCKVIIGRGVILAKAL